MKKICILVPLLLCKLFLHAQDNSSEDKNVVISKAKKEFSFSKGNALHPVQINEETNRLFFCKNYRTEIPVVEFYNDMETLDKVLIHVNESKKYPIVTKYETYTQNGIFYSDAKVAHFQLPLIKKGSTSEINIKKTILDPHYFTSVYFMDEQDIVEQEIKIVVPSWMQLDIKEFNFQQYGVQKNITTKTDETVYTYTLKNTPAFYEDNDGPGPSYFAPHILVLCKSAQPKDEKFIYFNTLKDQYNWYKKLVDDIGNDETSVKEKVEELIKGKTTDEEKVKAIFQWVQDNIRYIAFENGIAGFKPEKAQEVLRKKYGDCKGMANLLTVMLRSIKLDARRAWLGTNHIAYDYSTPSLSVDNHMICAWLQKGKTYFLDATEKYIGFGEIAERIQGRQTLIENGATYLLEKIPTATYTQNTAIEQRKLYIDGKDLKGSVKQSWKGENKEWLLSALNNINQDKQENALKQYLSEGKQNFEIINLKINNLTNYNEDLKVEYDIIWKDIVSVFDKEIYIDIDNRRFYENFKIDTAKRKLPYWFDFKNDLILETEIEIPKGKTVINLPEKVSIKNQYYSFNAGFTLNGVKLLYRNEVIVYQKELLAINFNQWNADIQKLNDFYNQQITITQK